MRRLLAVLILNMKYNSLSNVEHNNYFKMGVSSMGNRYLVDILQEGADVWNSWRKQHPEILLDFYALDLTGADLSGTDLTGAYFYKAVLYHTNLSNAFLSRAVLKDADLDNADLSQTDLS